MGHRCLVGRWGSVYGMETKLIEAGNRLIVPVFKHVFAKLANEPERAAEGDDGADPRAAAQAEYRCTRGRWVREVLDVQNRELFWVVVCVQHRAKAGPQHLFAYLQNNSGKGCVGKLVRGDALRILRDWDTYFCEEALAGLLRDASDTIASEANAFATLSGLHAAAGFHRRIVVPIQEWQSPLTWHGFSV